MGLSSAWHITMPHRGTFESPEQMLGLANDYFKWAGDNPLLEDKIFAFQGTLTHGNVKKLRVFTITAMCNHMGISQATWHNYRKEYDEYKDTVALIDKVIRDQKFTGATADLLNPMIISRDLGLAEKQIVESEVTNINLNKDMTEAEMAKTFEDKVRNENAT